MEVGVVHYHAWTMSGDGGHDRFWIRALECLKECLPKSVSDCSSE
jgi:hypothetical protein